MLAFERYMTFRKSGGNHCQLNVLPLPAGAAAGARGAFEQAAARHGLALQPLEGPAKVHAADCVGLGEGFVSACARHACKTGLLAVCQAGAKRLLCGKCRGRPAAQRCARQWATASSLLCCSLTSRGWFSPCRAGQSTP